MAFGISIKNRRFLGSVCLGLCLLAGGWIFISRQAFPKTDPEAAGKDTVSASLPVEGSQGLLLGPHQISLHDACFKQYAETLGWDWRLLASIAYQESKFHTDRVSRAGAVGLMGLMPKTASAFGLPTDSLTHPESNVRAATELIRRLNRSFAAIEDESERLKFILAAYNAGASRIYDAQALAEEQGKNPSQWENHVEECLRAKGLPETANYVQAILKRWRYYQTKIQ